jgi:hypothetical protein
MLAALNCIASSVWDKSGLRAGSGAICWALREAYVGPRPKASIYRRQISAFSRLLQEANSYSASQGISRYSCTCGSPQLVLFLSQVNPGHVPTTLFNIIFSWRTSPSRWLAIGFVFRRSQVEFSAQWLFLVFSSLTPWRLTTHIGVVQHR